MLPMEFDPQILGTVPRPSDRAAERVAQTLQSILTRKVFPHFRLRKGTDLIHLSFLKQNLDISRMEDEDNRIRIVSVLTRSGSRWTINVHERVFDHMAFVASAKPDFSIDQGGIETKRMVAFAEFLLRHQIEHILFPRKSEREVILSDAQFAMQRLSDDPVAYRMLRNGFNSVDNGLQAGHYLELLDLAERGKPLECAVGRIVNDCVAALGDFPLERLLEVFPDLDLYVKTRVLGGLFRKSGSTAYPLVKRASCLDVLLRLFALQIGLDEEEGHRLFEAFKNRWGLVGLFHELGLPEAAMEEKSTRELMDVFRTRLESDREQKIATSPQSQEVGPPAGPEPVRPQQTKSLKDRIEEAHEDPFFPPEVMELIDKNKLNAAGQSGAKYTELIETLLAIPWGKIRRIRISAEEFEEGLNRSHFGLAKPKEILCDFFANLIWRYRHFKESESRSWQHTGSALLFVGPPGVGKTSLAISIARNLGIPYHKVSLGGMKDEADMRGYGFTYEGSKPGPIVQGLIKMGVMNGMFILDEADKTERFAIATLLEILDPEQNHLFHDKYTQTTVDIDLSNCHFILTANTLETVPQAVLNRCEVIFLDRYSVEEKIAIARNYLVKRVCEKYMIGEDEIFFDPEEANELLRYLIRDYTFEAGVRDLERIIRTLFLRVQRKDIMGRGMKHVRITMDRIRQHLEEPQRPRQINSEDRVGEMMGLGVNMELGIGSLIPIQGTWVRIGGEKPQGSRGFISMLHTTGNIEKVMDESRKVALTAILFSAGNLGIDFNVIEDPVHLHFMGGSTKKDGPSAGGAIALALASLYTGRPVRRDVVMTGELDTQGRVTGIGGLALKLETAYAAGCKTMIIPRENLYGMDGIERLPEALKNELQILTYEEWKGPHEPFDYTRHMLQVVAVDNIVQAADIAFIQKSELDELDTQFITNARDTLQKLKENPPPELRKLRIVFVDDPEELDPLLVETRFCGGEFECVLLARDELRESILARVPGIEGVAELRDFDPENDHLGQVVRKIRAAHRKAFDIPLRITIIGPAPFLRKDGLRAEDFPPDSTFAGLRLFAGCCTAENVRIRDCRSLVNRAHRVMGRMGRELLDNCPFLALNDGIYSLSLSFIPEKYRLDVKRSEEIVNRCLGLWLDTVSVTDHVRPEGEPMASGGEPSLPEGESVSPDSDAPCGAVRTR